MNRIKILDTNLLKGADNLTHISLNSNPLEKIYFEEENEVSTLTNLDIRDSPIERNCLYLLEIFNLANDKLINLNINMASLETCLKT